MHTIVDARPRASKTNEYLGHSNLKMRQRLHEGLDPGAFYIITGHTLNRREITNDFPSAISRPRARTPDLRAGSSVITVFQSTASTASPKCRPTRALPLCPGVFPVL
jgi:hypothetical protein